MGKDNELDGLKYKMEVIGGSLLGPVLNLKESLLSDINGVPGKAPGASPVLPRLIAWAGAASRALGSERIAAVLEAAVMVGYLSPEMKDILNRHALTSAPSRVFTAVIDKTQLQALKGLTSILGRQSVSDLVMLQVTIQILLNYWQPGDGSQAVN